VSTDPKAAPTAGQVVKPVHVGRLETVTDWRRQVGKIYREMRRGELPHEHGTRLVYVAQIGASLVKIEQELSELQRLREQLARLQGDDAAAPHRPIAGLLEEGRPALKPPAADTEEPL
jgi:hypothetical protein